MNSDEDSHQISHTETLVLPWFSINYHNHYLHLWPLRFTFSHFGRVAPQKTKSRNPTAHLGFRSHLPAAAWLEINSGLSQPPWVGLDLVIAVQRASDEATESL